MGEPKIIEKLPDLLQLSPVDVFFQPVAEDDILDIPPAQILLIDFDKLIVYLPMDW